MWEKVKKVLGYIGSAIVGVLAVLGFGKLFGRRNTATGELITDSQDLAARGTEQNNQLGEQLESIRERTDSVETGLRESRELASGASSDIDNAIDNIDRSLELISSRKNQSNT